MAHRDAHEPDAARPGGEDSVPGPLSALLVAGWFGVLPMLALWYLDGVPGAHRPDPAPALHLVAVALATGWGALISYAAWRAYLTNRTAFSHRLALAFIGGTAVYALQSGLTLWATELPELFVLYGPASRLVLGGLLLGALCSYGQPNKTGPPQMSMARCLGALLLAAAGFAALAAGLSELLEPHLALEGLALACYLVLLLIGLGQRQMLRLPPSFWASIALFAQASLSFLLVERPWDQVFWYASLLFVGGFLLLGNIVLGSRSRGVAYSELFDAERLRGELDASTRRHEELLEIVTDGFFALDGDWRFTYVNAAGQHLLGRVREELQGRIVWDCFPAAVGTDFEQYYRRTMTQGQVSTFEAYYQPLETWFEVRCYPADGGIAVYFRDTTERKQAEMALARLHREKLLLLDSTGEGIYGLDAEGRCSFINASACRLLGYAAEELLGQEMHDAVHRHQSADGGDSASDCAIVQVLRTGTPHGGCEDVFWRKDGESLPVEYSAHPVMEEGAVAGAVVVFTDLTPRKRAEANRREQEALLQRTEKLASLGELSAGVAHEINNPLAYLKSSLGSLRHYCDQLLAAAPPTPRIEPLRQDLPVLLEDCRDGVAHIEEIVGGLRAFAHSGDQPWEIADLHDILETAVRLTRSELKYHVVLIRDYGALPAFECRPVQITQVAVNLLVNAAQAMAGGRGRVMLRTRPLNADRVRLEITDTGPGIPEEALERIFEPFYTTKPVGKGTGLGLSVCHRIVEAHGGEMSVLNPSGWGARFRVEFPLRRAVETAPSP